MTDIIHIYTTYTKDLNVYRIDENITTSLKNIGKRNQNNACFSIYSLKYDMSFNDFYDTHTRQ